MSCMYERKAFVSSIFVCMMHCEATWSSKLRFMEGARVLLMWRYPPRLRFQANRSLCRILAYLFGVCYGWKCCCSPRDNLRTSINPTAQSQGAPHALTELLQFVPLWVAQWCTCIKRVTDRNRPNETYQATAFVSCRTGPPLFQFAPVWNDSWQCESHIYTTI